MIDKMGRLTAVAITALVLVVISLSSVLTVSIIKKVFDEGRPLLGGRAGTKSGPVSPRMGFAPTLKGGAQGRGLGVVGGQD